MSPNLPDPESLQYLLDQWQAWTPSPPSRPRVTARLSNGLASQCWQLQVGEDVLAARLSAPGLRELNCGWQDEWLASVAAAQAGVAPAIRFADPEHLGMVLNWGGDPAQPEQLRQARWLTAVGRLLQQLHRHPLPLHQHGYGNTVERYRHLAGLDAGAVEELSRYAQHLDDSYPAVFCHHDLSVGNLLIKQDALLLVDWEYARRGAALFDLASLTHHLELSAEQTALLLTSYQAPAQFSADLADARTFVVQFGDLWTAAWKGLQDKDAEARMPE